eukprot:Skav231770  [mRNA]  locus=scaffold3283:31231:32394:+ [translate_table: standard]
MAHVAPMGYQMCGDLWQELSHLSQKVHFLEGALQLNMQAMNARIDASKSASDRADMWILKEVSAFRLVLNDHVAQLQKSLDAVMAEQESARSEKVANQSVAARLEEFECKIQAQHAECAKMHAELLKFVEVNASQLERLMEKDEFPTDLAASDSEPTTPHSSAEQSWELSPTSRATSAMEPMEPMELMEQELKELRSRLHDAEASEAKQPILEKLEDTKIRFQTELQAALTPNSSEKDALGIGQAQMKFDRLRGLLRLFPVSGSLEHMRQDRVMKEALKRNSSMEDVSNTLQQMQETQEINFDWTTDRFQDSGKNGKRLKDSDGWDSKGSPRDSNAEFNELRESILNELKANLEDSLQQIRQDIINEMNTKLDKKEPLSPWRLEVCA